MYEKYFGKYIDVVRVRSRKPSFGATTALIAYALDSNEIDGAIVVKADDNWNSKAVVIKDSEQLKSAIGTKWVITPMVDAIVDALKIGRLDRIAIIGTPCQCQAIRDMREYPMQVGDIFERIKLIVGLFCMGSFTQDGFKTMLEREMGISLPQIKSAEIKMNEFIVVLRNGEVRKISLESVRRDVKLACLSCDDFTAKSSDISFGMAGSKGDWRSCIIRSEYALTILRSAEKNGYVEVGKMDDEGIIDIVNQAHEKMRRASKI